MFWIVEPPGIDGSGIENAGAQQLEYD